jgi:hypothetical protein
VDVNVLVWFTIFPKIAYIIFRIIPESILGGRETGANQDIILSPKQEPRHFKKPFAT